MTTVRDLMKSNRLDASVPLYDKTIPMDGTSLTPEGWCWAGRLRDRVRVGTLR